MRAISVIVGRLPDAVFDFLFDMFFTNAISLDLFDRKFKRLPGSSGWVAIPCESLCRIPPAFSSATCDGSELGRPQGNG